MMTSSRKLRRRQRDTLAPGWLDVWDAEACMCHLARSRLLRHGGVVGEVSSR